MEQNREPRNKSTHIWSINMTKELSIYNWERTVFSINVVEKIGEPHAKE